MKELILDVLPYVLSIIVSVLTITISVVKVVRNGASSKESTKLLNLVSKIPDLVVSAEEIYGSGKGVAKLDYVLTKLKLEAMTIGVAVDENYLINAVENTVKATKTVNTVVKKSV